MNLNVRRLVLAKKTALLMFCVIALATATRPIFADLPIVLTYIGIANSIVAGLLTLVMYLTSPKPWYPYLVIVTAFLFLLPLLLISGGVHSQFAFVIPVFPIFACLLVSAKAGMWVSVVLISVILASHIFDQYMPVLDAFSAYQDISNARTFWLCVATLISSFFGFQFDRLSRHLGSKVTYQATYDTLTNVFNRRSILTYLDELVETLESRKQWVSVLVVDIDDCKKLNNQFGHQFTDECIQMVADSLKHSIRSELDGLGRYSGEEFLVVLSDVDQSNTHKIAEKIRLAIARNTLNSDQQVVEVTVTVGYNCLISDEIPDIEFMIKQAEDALKIGKQQGGNCVVGAEEGKMVSSKLQKPIVPSEGEVFTN